MEKYDSNPIPKNKPKIFEYIEDNNKTSNPTFTNSPVTFLIICLIK